MAARKLYLSFNKGCDCGDSCNGCSTCSAANYPRCKSCDGMILIPHNPAILVAPARYIVANIVSGPTDANGVVRYTLEFDDAVLVNPAQVLPQCDFRACCYDCSAKFAELAAEFDTLDTLTVDLTFANDTLSADVNISAAPGNGLVVNADGLFVASETPLTPVDTATVNLTANGTANHTLQADVNVSALAGNGISIQPDGLYSPSLQVVDTATIDHTLVAGVLSSDVKVSATPGNIIVINPDGLYAVAPPGNTDSLVDNGDRTFTHTAVDGAVQTFCQGIQSVRADDNCANAGVGAGKTVRGAAFNGCELILDADEMPKVATSGGPAAGLPGPIGLNAAGTVTAGSTSAFVMNNPSQCKSMYVNTITIVGFGIISRTGLRVIFRRERSINGSPYNLEQVTQFDYPYNSNAVGVELRGDDWDQVVAPGGSLTIEERGAIQVIAGQAGAQWINYVASVRTFGITI